MKEVDLFLITNHMKCIMCLKCLKDGDKVFNLKILDQSVIICNVCNTSLDKKLLAERLFELHKFHYKNRQDICECGRNVEESSSTCSRWPMCKNKVLYP